MFVGWSAGDEPGARPANSRTRIPVKGGGDVMADCFRLFKPDQSEVNVMIVLFVGSKYNY